MKRHSRRVTVLMLFLLGFSAKERFTFSQNFNLKLISFTGEIPPGTFNTLGVLDSKPFINDLGEIFFLGRLGGNSAIFRFSDNKLLLLASRGDPAPGNPGDSFLDFHAISANRRGELAFIASTRAGDATRRGIFLFSKTGISGLAVEGLFDGRVLSFVDLSLNDLGDVAFSTPDGRVFLVSRGTISLVASSTTGVAGFATPSLNNRGEVAFVNWQRAGLLGDRVENTGISLFSGGRVTTIFSGSGSLVPSLNNSGLVAFSGCRTPEGCGIYLYRDGMLSIVVREGPTVLGPPQLNDASTLAYTEAHFFGNVIVQDAITLLQNGKFARITSEDRPGETACGKFVQFVTPALSNAGALAFSATVRAAMVEQGPGLSIQSIFLAELAAPRTVYLPHFADGVNGELSFSSEISLANLESNSPADAALEFNDDAGMPLAVSVDGVLNSGRKNVRIPGRGLIVLKTDSVGPLRAGSIVVASDARLTGVIFVRSAAGVIGVPEAKPLLKLLIPVKIAPGINTALALTGIGTNQLLQLELRDEQGTSVAKASLLLGARSHVARFVGEFPWVNPPALRSFSGTLTASGLSVFTAAAVRTGPDGWITLPLTESK